MRKKKILIYTVPFGGHLFILRDFAKKYKNKFEIKVVITGWENISPDLKGIEKESIVLFGSKLMVTDPGIWTFPRVNELLEECLKIAKDFSPNIILYDFLSLEGYFVGQILDIPTFSSIPAMIGPNSRKNYLDKKLSYPENKKSIKDIENKFGISIDLSKIEMISDGLHIPGKNNLVWSYEFVLPSDWKKNRSKDNYYFIGNIRAKKHAKVKNKIPVIYFSLGTVVMGNLWNQQENTREALRKFIYEISEKWKNEKVKVIFVSQGKEILSNYPDNWKVFNFLDQIKTLQEADIFITHAGGNSFNEALIQKVPMICIPFFGDQLLIARQVEKLGIGVNLVKDSRIDTDKSKDFLNEDLVIKLDKAVWKILTSNKYQKNFDKISTDHENIEWVLNNHI